MVTAFITMSDIKDEIDWEFPGNDTLHGQTNFFWQGVIRTYYSGLTCNSSNVQRIAPKTDGSTSAVSSDTYSNYHDYSVSADACLACAYF